jgi:hypothetical protein
MDWIPHSDPALPLYLHLTEQSASHLFFALDDVKPSHVYAGNQASDVGAILGHG